MTNARPHIISDQSFKEYDTGYCDGYNQSHAEWTAYTDDLLRPLEEIVKKYSDENYVGISATIILNQVNDVLQKHKAGTGEGK